MLTLQTTATARDCSGLSRRNFLRAGALGLGGLTLPWLLEARAAAAALEPSWVKDRSVVMVFLGGGASHIETFNPNMDGPEQSRSVTGEVKTTLPGVTFGGTFPELAKHAKDAVIVRSFKHPIGGHEQAISHVLTGGTDVSGTAKDGHSIGSLYARVRGANHPKTGLPTYALLTDPHKDPQYNREKERVTVGSRSGPLGATCEPFVPAGKGPALRNMELNVPASRFAERLELLRGLDDVERSTEGAAQSSLEQQALDLLTRGAGEAFDITKEPKSVRDKYDTTAFKTGKKTFEPCIIGKQFLMARRLIESGVGFVTVQSAGWDMHADGNNPAVKEGMEMLGRPLDKALGTFLTDLSERGLLEKTLVVVTGDFGRTPKINKNGGRDHWPNLCTLALFGGSLKTGQVVGRSARTNDVPASDPITPAHLTATVMHHLFDVGAIRITRDLPAALANLVAGSDPIPGVF